jgi:Ca2+-transporting ATPase
MEIGSPIINERKIETGWYTLENEAVVLQLKSSTDQGLGSSEAVKRLKKVGLNQLNEAESITFWQMIWEQLNSFVIWLLIGASSSRRFLEIS